MNYQEALFFTQNITDEAGTPVDEGIQHAVAALRFAGYSTSSSCAGHLKEGNKTAPFIQLCMPEPIDVKNEDARMAWLQANLTQQKYLYHDLEDFYRTHTPDSLKAQLVLNTFGPGITELHSYGAAFTALEDDPHHTHVLYQAEMDLFADFIIKKTEAV